MPSVVGAFGITNERTMWFGSLWESVIAMLFSVSFEELTAAVRRKTEEEKILERPVCET